MSSTNHTTNYNLPQFLGADKPAWLSDINPAMSAIDTAMHNNAVKAQQGVDDASTAQTTADNAETHAQTAITNAGTAQRTADTAIGDISTVNTKLTTLNNRFILSDISTTDWKTSNNVDVKYTLAQNTEGSVFKFYGFLSLNNNTSSTMYLNRSREITVTVNGEQHIALKSGLYLNSAPQNAYIITPAGIMLRRLINTTPNHTDSDTPLYIIVNTDGEILIAGWNAYLVEANHTQRYWFNPCLYFNTNFGDLPNPSE